MELDLLIIGGSSAGTPAAIYAARRGLNFKVITKDFNGELATSGEIGNWPGIPQTNGIELAQKFRDHLEFLKVPIEEGIEVEKIEKQEDGLFCVTTKKEHQGKMASSKIEGNENGVPTCDYTAKSVIVATGAHPKKLGVPGEDKYRNKGVSYCTTCDGPLFAGKTVATIGGGNSALESALMLADIASKVYIINKNPEFKGDEVLIKNLESKKNVDIIASANTKEIVGGEFVTGIKYEREGRENDLNTEGIFIHIGMIANSGVVGDMIEKNKFGEIKVNTASETSLTGLFAAGDVTDAPFKQNTIAAGQGTTALLSAVSYLNKLSK